MNAPRVCQCHGRLNKAGDTLDAAPVLAASVREESTSGVSGMKDEDPASRMVLRVNSRDFDFLSQPEAPNEAHIQMS
jgi:hypothetical protein